MYPYPGAYACGCVWCDGIEEFCGRKADAVEWGFKTEEPSKFWDQYCKTFFPVTDGTANHSQISSSLMQFIILGLAKWLW